MMVIHKLLPLSLPGDCWHHTSLVLGGRFLIPSRTGRTRGVLESRPVFLYK